MKYRYSFLVWLLLGLLVANLFCSLLLLWSLPSEEEKKLWQTQQEKWAKKWKRKQRELEEEFQRERKKWKGWRLQIERELERLEEKLSQISRSPLKKGKESLPWLELERQHREILAILEKIRQILEKRQ